MPTEFGMLVTQAFWIITGEQNVLQQICGVYRFSGESSEAFDVGVELPVGSAKKVAVAGFMGDRNSKSSYGFCLRREIDHPSVGRLVR